MLCLVAIYCAPHAWHVEFLPSSRFLCETSARSERHLFPSSENDGPKTLTTGYIPMTDVYDKDVSHIFLHTRAHTLHTLKQ